MNPPDLREPSSPRGSPVTLLTFLAIILSRPSPADDAPAEPAVRYLPACAEVSERSLRSTVGFLASAELTGREPGTDGFRVASRYVASELEACGVEPGGDDGTYFQNFELVRHETLLAEATLERGDGEDADEVELEGRIAAELRASIDWRGPWAFAGHGEAGEVDGRDDFHALETELGETLADTVVLVFPPRRREVPLAFGARTKGVHRLVVVADGRTIRRRQRSRRGRLLPPYRVEEPDPAAPDTVWITAEVADFLLAPEGTSVAELRDADPARSFVFRRSRPRLAIERRETSFITRNVVGVLPGRDDDLRAEHVSLGAHLDHVGGSGERIFHGADDDGSGCAVLLEIARAYSRMGQRPRRSLLLLFYSAEEIGLIGSRYFVDHPTVPLEDLVVNFNLDMVGRNEERRSDDPEKAERAEDNVLTIHPVGSRRHSLELQPWIDRLNEREGLVFEQDEEENVYRRSDHYNFAERGVPVTFFFGGFHPDYHQVTDTAEKLNYDKMARLTRLLVALTYEIAERPRRLVNNRL